MEDQKLIAVHQTHQFQVSADVARLVNCSLPRPFHAGQLAESLGVHRWMAQRIAYCLRQTGAVREVGKQGRDYHNARLAEYCDRQGIPLADICAHLCDEDFAGELHPNAVGAKIIAEEVFKVLKVVHNE